MVEKLEKLFRDKELLPIVEKAQDLLKFQALYETVSYLALIDDEGRHDNFLYEIYDPTLKFAGTSSAQPFTDFKQPNYDTLNILKWRWADSNYSLKTEEMK